MRETITFTNARGVSVSFGRTPPLILNSHEGLSKTDADLQTTDVPYLDGETYIDSILDPRDIKLETTVKTKTEKELYQYKQQIMKVFNPKMGIGTLKYENDFITAEIGCVSEATPDFPSGKGDRSPIVQRVNLELFAPDPYFKDLNQVSRALRAYEGKFTLPFTLPFRLGKQGDRTSLVNDGDVPAPVKIDLQGPVTNPKITNETTGEFIQINGSVASDEILHIDTEPGNKRIEAYSGNIVRSLFGRLAFENGAEFWQLEPGTNEVSYVADEGNNDAIVAVSWHNRFSGI